VSNKTFSHTQKSPFSGCFLTLFLPHDLKRKIYRESLRDVTTCLSAQKNKSYHLGFQSPVVLQTLAYANERRDFRIYRDLATVLIKKARSLYLDEPDIAKDIDGACYAIDSSSIDLCLSIFPWAPFVSTKAALKLHLVMDIRGSIPTFFDMTSGNVNDVNFLDLVIFEPGAFYIMDRGYLDFGRLYEIHTKGAFFVTRAKRNTRMKRRYSNPVDKTVGVRVDQVVLYKNRWQIELFFKWIKQHLKIKTFWGHSENAVKTQICIALCSYLIVAVLKKERNIDRDLYEILQISSVSLFDKSGLDTLFSKTSLQNGAEGYEKTARLPGF